MLNYKFIRCYSIGFFSTFISCTNVSPLSTGCRTLGGLGLQIILFKSLQNCIFFLTNIYLHFYSLLCSHPCSLFFCCLSSGVVGISTSYGPFFCKDGILYLKKKENYYYRKNFIIIFIQKFIIQ